VIQTHPGAEQFDGADDAPLGGDRHTDELLFLHVTRRLRSRQYDQARES
jgi:hypothetical protein